MNPTFSRIFFLPLFLIATFAININAKDKEILIKYSQILDENNTIAGRLYDVDGYNIAEAKISVSNYALTVKSDIDGYFTINLPPSVMNDKRVTLVVENKGYKTKTIFFYTPITVNNDRLIKSSGNHSITIEQVESDQNLIKGIITGDTDGIGGMSVMISDQKIGTITDMKGEFQLNLPDTLMNIDEITLNLSSIGYAPLSVKINTSEIPLMIRIKIPKKTDSKTVSPTDKRKKFNDNIY